MRTFFTAQAPSPGVVKLANYISLGFELGSVLGLGIGQVRL